MSAPQSAVAALDRAAEKLIDQSGQARELSPKTRKHADAWMLAGIAITFAALAAGIAVAKIPIAYFFQPSGVLIVIGGTLGATIVTTPRRALQDAARRVLGLWWEHGEGRAELVEEIMSYVRLTRVKGLLAVEPKIRESRHEFLRECLTLALDVQKNELRPAMESRMRLRERRGDADARTLEIAGGFAPTIGVLGTVVGLIDVLRRFSDLNAVASGVGTAFASTLYGIGLANLLLLPLAHRIRAAVAAGLEKEELVLEGVGCILDGVHPKLAAERLKAFLEHQHTA
jgi:chemotaxis protein MotA